LNTRHIGTFPANLRNLIDFDPATRPEHDEHVIQMNEVHRCVSGSVQHAPTKVASMIEEPGHPTGQLRDPREETTMFKTISAALLAASVLVAAPAMAAGHGRTAHAPGIKSLHVKPGVLNAHAGMGRHHHRHFHHHRHHYRFHNHR
jgi:hypothetical protein